MYPASPAEFGLTTSPTVVLPQNNSLSGKLYLWLIIAVGWTIITLSAFQLRSSKLDYRLLLLAVMVAISSRAAVKIPRISGLITLGDTFLFVTILLFGGPAAAVLGGLEGLATSVKISRKPRTYLVNAAILATSTFVTASVLRLLFGPTTEIARVYSASFLVAMCVMALAQYLTNTALVATEKSSRIKKSIWFTWKTYYLWISISVFAGASAAGIIAHLIRGFGFYAVLATFPIAVIVHFTYDIYLKNLEASAKEAKLAQQHVEELSQYVADLKRSEEERNQLLLREQQARGQAEVANRMKDEFLATLSHELRTPLTVVLGWACLLGEGVSADESAKAVKTIERNARLQAQLIDDLLDVSRIISGKLHLDVRPIDLATVAEAAVAVLRPAAEAKSLQLAFLRPATMRTISGDSARLQQVVWNLLSNAVKFTPEGGRIEVHVEYINARAYLRITDTGRGIRSEFLPFVFDRFRQADSSTTRAFGGLGLGLAIVRHLVELHGGTVTAESAGPGLGATFEVSFPLIANRLEGLPDAQTEAYHCEPAKLGGLRVLVVDDESDARQLMSRLVARTGAEVKTCGSAREAVELVRTWRPDALISDIAMPDEDGYSLIRKIRALPAEQGGHTPAAAFTAYARDQDRNTALAAGYQLHVAKPVSSERLTSTLTELLKQSGNGRVQKVTESSAEPVGV